MKPKFIITVLAALLAGCVTTGSPDVQSDPRLQDMNLTQGEANKLNDVVAFAGKRATMSNLLGLISACESLANELGLKKGSDEVEGGVPPEESAGKHAEFCINATKSDGDWALLAENYDLSQKCGVGDRYYDMICRVFDYSGSGA